jgi:hypothetical protein
MAWLPDNPLPPSSHKPSPSTVIWEFTLNSQPPIVSPKGDTASPPTKSRIGYDFNSLTVVKRKRKNVRHKMKCFIINLQNEHLLKIK